MRLTRSNFLISTLFFSCIILTIILILSTLSIDVSQTTYKQFYNETAKTIEGSKQNFKSFEYKRKYSNWRNLTLKEIRKLSELGKILYLQKEPSEPQPRRFNILVWNGSSQLKRRHIYRFGNTSHNPWENCLVDNCRITYDRADLNAANAVLIHLQQIKSIKELPPRKLRNPNQVWIMLTDESPYHTFLHRITLDKFNGFFNWTMTYRMDSDVPVPYGRTIQESNWNQLGTKTTAADLSKSVHIVNLSSHCGGVSGRWNYIDELKKHIPVDIIGKCGKKLCPGHFFKPCDAIGNYTFYLAFENSNCAEYITEKLWWNSYNYNLIPIILGPSIKDCERLLPPNSYIHVDNFSGPRSLALYLKHLLNSPIDFQKYFVWKHNYEILNEHGYFGTPSYHFCRICEALNFNSNQSKTYNDLNSFWSVKKDCRAGVIY